MHRNIESQPVSIAVQMKHKQAGVKHVKAVPIPSIDEYTRINRLEHSSKIQYNFPFECPEL